MDHPSIAEKRSRLKMLLHERTGEQSDAGWLPNSCRERARSSSSILRDKTDDRAIAIVGVSGRYPKARTLNEFWKNLVEGRDCIEEVPKERWAWQQEKRTDDATEPYLLNRWGGFIDGVGEFDPLFFNMLPIDAQHTDPQERLLLMHAWHALEMAGYTPQTVGGGGPGDAPRVGVYVGTMYSEYGLLRGSQTESPVISIYGSLANRVSYFMNFQGPSMAIDTMCSSSLTAIHLACQDLRSGCINAALAGGANLSLHPDKYGLLSHFGFISPQGRCASFSESADGYVPGEGVGLAVLKRLADAERDRDNVLGVILGSALNHGGRTTGYTKPNSRAQRSVIRQALADAGVRPDEVTYVEAHGTGTQLGDPIEITGLTQAFGGDDARSNARHFVGSVKSNVGHLEGAAGIVALSKVLLQIQHRQLAPSIHSEKLNGKIDFDGSPFEVVRELQTWHPNDGGRLIAGISSFGAGGSNAHMIVGEYIAPNDFVPEDDALAAYVLPLSARDEAALGRLLRELLEYVESSSCAPLRDVAHTLQLGRVAFDHRVCLVVRSRGELTQALRDFVAGASPGNVVQGVAVKNGESFIPSFDVSTPAGAKELARRWVSGTSIDWSSFSPAAARRVPVTYYPFSRERYWLPDVDNTARFMGCRAKSCAGLANSSTVERPTADGVISEFSKLTSTPPAEVDLDSDIAEFGVESATLAEFRQCLISRFGDMPKEVFFNCRTFREIADYLSGSGHSQRVTQARDRRHSVNRASTSEAVAIVGMQARFPGADDLASFEANLRDARRCIADIADVRWPLAGFFKPDAESAVSDGKSYCRWGAFVDDFERFDPVFFGLSKSEALEIDPQERLFLQTCWQAVEAAGVTSWSMSEDEKTRWGVFGAVTNPGDRVSPAAMVNRTSHFLDFRGPSTVVDNMCASSLVAVQQAVQQLRTGVIDGAVVGAVNLYLDPRRYIQLSKQRLISDTGQIELFGQGRGFVPGEGIAAVVLKRQCDAIRDGDEILALVKGVAVQHAGRTMSFGTPDALSLTQVVEAAIRDAGLSAEDISYCECAASGSESVDSTELSAMRRVFSSDAIPIIGSLKNTIGHSEAASGLAQMIKVILQLRAHCIFPMFGEPGELAGFSAAGAPTPWRRAGAGPRRAGVTALGAGGVYGHVVLEEGGSESSTRARGTTALLTVSARSQSALLALRGSIAKFLRRGADLGRVAFTLQTGREHYRYRFACLADSQAEAVARLVQEADGVRSFQGAAPRRGNEPAGVSGTLNLPEIAEDWVLGHCVEWSLLYDGKPSRLHGVPGHPLKLKDLVASN